MEYITISDVQDKLLNVTVNEIAEANFYIDSLADRMGVASTEIKTPIMFNIKRLAVCYACYSRCLSCVGTDATTTFDGGSRQDIYSQKLEYYKKELDALENKLTVADFTGQKAGGTCIGIWRA